MNPTCLTLENVRHYSATAYSCFRFTFRHAGLGAPGGDIVSSAKDLVRWLYLLTHGGLNEAGERVLDEQVLKEAMSPHAVTWPQDGDEPLSSTSENYGYGWYTGHYKGSLNKFC